MRSTESIRELANRGANTKAVAIKDLEGLAGIELSVREAPERKLHKQRSNGSDTTCFAMVFIFTLLAAAPWLTGDLLHEASNSLWNGAYEVAL